MNEDVTKEIGRRIGDAFAQARPKLSQRKAAELAGISEGWWRQVVAGGVRRGALFVPLQASPDVYMAMAEVVGIADEVRELLGDEAPPDVRPKGQDVGMGGHRKRSDSGVDELREIARDLARVAERLADYADDQVEDDDE